MTEYRLTPIREVMINMALIGPFTIGGGFLFHFVFDEPYTGCFLGGIAGMLWALRD